MHVLWSVVDYRTLVSDFSEPMRNPWKAVRYYQMTVIGFRQKTLSGFVIVCCVILYFAMSMLTHKYRQAVFVLTMRTVYSHSHISLE